MNNFIYLVIIGNIFLLKNNLTKDIDDIVKDIDDIVVNNKITPNFPKQKKDNITKNEENNEYNIKNNDENAEDTQQDNIDSKKNFNLQKLEDLKDELMNISNNFETHNEYMKTSVKCINGFSNLFFFIGIYNIIFYIYQSFNKKEDKVMINKLKVIAQRSQLLLESKEIHEITKTRINEFLSIILAKKDFSNAESKKAFLAIETIIFGLVLEEDQKKNTEIITNKFKTALNEKKMDDYKDNIKNEIKKKLFIQDLKNLTIDDENKLYESSNALKIFNNFMNDVKEISNPEKGNNKRFCNVLCGSAGTGKTKCIQVLSKLCNIPCMVLNADQEKTYFDGIDYCYVGSRPGAIMKAFKETFGGEARLANNTASNIGVLLIDEIDKLPKETMDTLLKFLDNSNEGEDKYLKIPVPMKNVIVYCTANDITKLTAPLQDRLRPIQMESMSYEEKENILKKSIIIPLKKNFNDININFNKEAIDFLMKQIPNTDGVRKSIEYGNKISSELVNYFLENIPNDKTINITKDLIQKLSDEDLNNIDNIYPNKSEIGYLNGIIVAEKYNNNGKKEFFLNTANLCMTQKDSNTLNLFLSPYNKNIESKLLSVLCEDTSNAMNIKYNITLDIKNSDKNSNIYAEDRSLSALLLIVWKSITLGQKIKPNCTIIADLLPNQTLEYADDTINKIKLAYNSGLTNIVIGTIDNQKQDIKESSEFKKLAKEFNLTYDNTHNIYINNTKDTNYSNIKICIPNTIEEAINFCLINELII